MGRSGKEWASTKCVVRVSAVGLMRIAPPIEEGGSTLRVALGRCGDAMGLREGVVDALRRYPGTATPVYFEIVKETR